METIDPKENDLKQETVQPTSQEAKHWSKSTSRLSMGIAFASILLVLYSGLMFIDFKSTPWLYVGYILLAIVLAFFCISNYLKGLSRFTAVFEAGGKRSLFILRWSFLAAVAGVILQIFLIYKMPSHEVLPMQEVVGEVPKAPVNWNLIWAGNALYVVSAIIAVIGFLSLSTCKGIHDDGRKGALNLAWVSILLTLCAVFLSFALTSTTFVKVISTIVTLVATYFYYHNWKRVIYRSFEEETTAVTDNTSTPQQEETTAE